MFADPAAVPATATEAQEAVVEREVLMSAKKSVCCSRDLRRSLRVRNATVSIQLYSVIARSPGRVGRRLSSKCVPNDRPDIN